MESKNNNNKTLELREKLLGHLLTESDINLDLRITRGGYPRNHLVATTPCTTRIVLL